MGYNDGRYLFLKSFPLHICVLALRFFIFLFAPQIELSSSLLVRLPHSLCLPLSPSHLPLCPSPARHLQDKVSLPSNPLIIAAASNLSPEETRALILRLKIDELTKQIANPMAALKDIPEAERSPSPEPQVRSAINF